MNKLVEIKLDGKLDKNLVITLKMGEDGKYPPTEKCGSLPPVTSLKKHFLTGRKRNRKWGLAFLGITSSTVALLLGLGFIRLQPSLSTNSNSHARSTLSIDSNAPLEQFPSSSSLQFQKYAKKFNQVDFVPRGLFNYGGSTAWAPIRGQVDPAIQHIWPEFRLRHIEHLTLIPSSETGIRMLLTERLSFSESSRPLKPAEYELAQQANFRLRQIPVAINSIVFVVHPQLDIAGLTLTQLREIYLGKITNWEEVGGPNCQIIPYSKSPQTSGIAQFISTNLLNQENFGRRVKFVSSTTQTLRQVATSCGAIFYASGPEVIGQCTVKPLPLGYDSQKLTPPYIEPLVLQSQCPERRNRLNYEAFLSADYPLTHYLYVIVKENGLLDEEAGKAYVRLLLSEEGQQLIAKAGFVPIR